MEKVITEWRIVETDDGFRIEIKGDKDRLREWVNKIGARGPMHRAHHWRHFGFGGPGIGHCGPWGWPQDQPESEEGKK